MQRLCLYAYNMLIKYGVVAAAQGSATYSLASSDMPSGSSKSWVTTGDAARMRPKTAPHVVDSSIHTADSCNGPATISTHITGWVGSPYLLYKP